MSEMLEVKAHSVSETARSRDGVDILEVSVMVETSNGFSEYKGEAGPDGIELKSDPSAQNLHPDDLKELMNIIASHWRVNIGDFQGKILSRDDPVSFE